MTGWPDGSSGPKVLEVVTTRGEPVEVPLSDLPRTVKNTEGAVLSVRGDTATFYQEEKVDVLVVPEYPVAVLLSQVEHTAESAHWDGPERTATKLRAHLLQYREAVG